MTVSEIRAFAPATVGNVAVGFDVLGLAVEQPGDVVLARKAPEGGAVHIGRIAGGSGRIPLEAHRNSAAVAARALMERHGAEEGLELELEKGLPLAGGMGGSAASAVAAVVAVDALFGFGSSRELLLSCALEGERAACGAAHPDNAAPCLYGGIVLTRSVDPVDVVELPVPDGLAVALVRPHVEVETAGARKVLGTSIHLATAVEQWGNLGAFVAALYTRNWDLLERSVVDLVAEPHRAAAVPGFTTAKAGALAAGALACSLSGSGPTTFALCRSSDTAHAAARAMAAGFRRAGNVPSDVHVSAVNRAGARVLEP